MAENVDKAVSNQMEFAQTKLMIGMANLMSRKFLIGLVFVLVVVLNGAFKWGLTAEDFKLMLIPVMGFVGVEGVRDISELWKKS